MEKRFGNRKTGKLLAAAVGAAGLAGFGTTEADASLLIDVRAAGSTGGTVVSSKSVELTGPGDTVTMNIYARVSGTDGVNNETFNSVYGLLNSAGLLKGNLTGGPVVPFRDSSFQNGSTLDWDSDGDLDIGMSPTHSGSTGKFFARNATSGGLPMQSVVNAQESESLIGQIVFTATALGDFTDVNFTIRQNNGNNINGGGAALWFEDGQSTSKNTTNSPNTVGLPVHIVVPEPASLGLMALASVGLLGRRRKA